MSGHCSLQNSGQGLELTAAAVGAASRQAGEAPHPHTCPVRREQMREYFLRRLWCSWRSRGPRRFRRDSTCSRQASQGRGAYQQG
jgi:hypothetical protein